MTRTIDRTLDHVELRPGEYHDSVVLMRISAEVRRREGIEDCLVAMATPLNLGLLEDLGFDADGLAGARPADLVVAIRARNRDALDAALDGVMALLAAPASGGLAGAAIETHPSLEAALRGSGAGLAVISVPGPHVVPEAMDALRAGVNVMIFSDGVTLEEERRLKAFASARDLLVLGPDCGTARLGGVGIGFCNALSDGDVGIVAASGTGAQQVSCLLDARGIGISHIVGVGGRDATDAIGGVSTIRALQLLDADPGTKAIALVSKPPGPATARRLEEAVASLDTPVVLGLLGASVASLTEIAEKVALACGRPFAEPRATSAERSPTGGRIVGLYSGGTLAEEARRIVAEAGVAAVGLKAFPSPTPSAIAGYDGDTIVDLGDDRLTSGRPHPMIDPTVRVEIVEALARRRAPVSLLLDVVLGHGAHEDPVVPIADALAALLAVHPENRIAASLIGTDGDPQDLDRQWRMLAELGCAVYESNAQAAAAVASARRAAGGAR